MSPFPLITYTRMTHTLSSLPRIRHSLITLPLIICTIKGMRCFTEDLQEDDEPLPEGEEEEEEEEEDEEEEGEVEEDDEGMLGGGAKGSGEASTLWPTSGWWLNISPTLLINMYPSNLLFSCYILYYPPITLLLLSYYPPIALLLPSYCLFFFSRSPITFPLPLLSLPLLGVRARWLEALQHSQTVGEVALALSSFLEFARSFGMVDVETEEAFLQVMRMMVPRHNPLSLAPDLAPTDSTP